MLMKAENFAVRGQITFYSLQDLKQFDFLGVYKVSSLHIFIQSWKLATNAKKYHIALA